MDPLDWPLVLGYGAKVQLVGLSKAALNGSLGVVVGLLNEKGRWPVSISSATKLAFGWGNCPSSHSSDGRALKGAASVLSIKPTNLRLLGICAHCQGIKLANELLKCGTCSRVVYCNTDCLENHWTLRTKSPRPIHDDILGQMGVEGATHKSVCSAPVPCAICKGGPETGDPLPLRMGCACSPDQGWAHLACVLKVAGREPDAARFNHAWHTCLTCQHAYTGALQLSLAQTAALTFGAIPYHVNSKPAAQDPADDDQDCAIVDRARVQQFLGDALLQRDDPWVSTIDRAHRAETAYRAMITAKGSGQPTPPWDAEAVRSDSGVAKSLVAQGKTGVAEVLLSTAFTRIQETLAIEHDEAEGLACMLPATSIMAHVQLERGNYPEAERLLRKTMAMQEQQLGQDDEEALTSGHRLAQALANQGQVAAAEALARSVVERSRNTLGEEHPVTLAASLELVRVLGCQQQHNDVAATCDAILPRLRIVHGAEHPAVAECVIWRGYAEDLAKLAVLKRAPKRGAPAGASEKLVRALQDTAVGGFRTQRQTHNRLPPPLRSATDAKMMRNQSTILNQVLTNM